jgi:hypothetical protein
MRIMYTQTTASNSRDCKDNVVVVRAESEYIVEIALCLPCKPPTRVRRRN